MHNTLGVVDEKITGPKAREYTDVINQEAQLYMSGEQSLDATVKNIKERADKILISM
jgi:multiple sugar transport system substrate-binding protein